VLLDTVLGNDTFLNQEVEDLVTVISLELDNLSELLIANDAAVAAEVLHVKTGKTNIRIKFKSKNATSGVKNEVRVVRPPNMRKSRHQKSEKKMKGKDRRWLSKEKRVSDAIHGKLMKYNNYLPNSVIRKDARTRLNALRILFRSRSSGNPCRVVKVFLPVRCWIRISVN
jgi:hypothetical protein